MKIKYKVLAVYKEFPRHKLIGVSEDEYYQYIMKFIEDYEDGNKGTPPTYNFLKHIVFDTRQGPFDIYSYNYFNSSIIVSNRLLEILREYNLQEHKVFPGVRYTFKGEERDDMNFLVFYNDYEQNVDYAKSTYLKVHHDFFNSRDKDGNYRKDLIIEDDLRLKSKEHFLFAKKRDWRSNDPYVIPKYLFCPRCIEKDLFFFNDQNRGLYVSPRLEKRLEKEKIKGVDYRGGGPYFDFTG